MRYLLIDPATQSITEGDHAGQISWKEIVALLGCSTMCNAGRLPNGDLLWVDDDGLLKPGPIDLFSMPAVNKQPLAFRGVITGPEHRETEEIVDATTPLAMAFVMVTWEQPAKAVRMVQTVEDLPGVRHISIRPEFVR